MKRKTAILYGESWLEDEYLDAEDREFIEVALKALEQEPCEDAISHDDRLIDLANAIESDDSGYWTNKRISSALRNISSVTQKSIECEDAISRQAVLETIDSRIEQIKRDAVKINKSYSHLSFAEGVHDGYCRLKCDLRILPSVNSQEPKSTEEATKEFKELLESGYYESQERSDKE